MSVVKIAVADDQPMFRSGLVSLLNEFPGIEVVAEVANGKEMIKALRKKNVHIAILDYRMPEMNGAETAKLIKEHFPAVRILMLSMFQDEEFIIGTIKNGANGYLTKDDEPDEILMAIESIMSTGYYINDRVSKVLVSNMMSKDILKPNFKKDTVNIKFSDNEIMVMRLLARELGTREIADQMNKSERTVDGYRQEILEKTGAKNSVGIVMFAIKAGIVRV